MYNDCVCIIVVQRLYCTTTVCIVVQGLYYVLLCEGSGANKYIFKKQFHYICDLVIVSFNVYKIRQHKVKGRVQRQGNVGS